ncbi:MAG: hypothetical protein LUF85_03220 [Bacteroides sp.]|nr:hypothetical protein [Bacteroides sp.]
MKRLLTIFCCFVTLFVFAKSSRVKLDVDPAEFLEISPSSLGDEMIVMYNDQEYLEIYFNLNMPHVNIKIENNEDLSVVYYEEVNPQLYSHIFIPISDLLSGSYTIYVINPFNGGAMRANFYKE